MIDLKNFIKEGLLSKKATTEDIMQATDIFVKEFICKNYIVYDKMVQITPNIDNFDKYFKIEYDKNIFWVSSSHDIGLNSDAPSITIPAFKFKSLVGFTCSNNQNITSLKELPKNIRYIGLNFCDNIKVLDLPFKNLHTLIIAACDNLEQINSPIKKAKFISITKCPKLKSLGFPNLQKVSGRFDVSENILLRSLEGSPKEFSESFDCNRCPNLKNLVGAPKEVKLSFRCSYCKNLTSLTGAPEETGAFICYNDPITSLEGSPRYVHGDFSCVYCDKLESLKGAPEEVDGSFECNACGNLTSLEGAPKKIGRTFICSGAPITSLKGAPEYIGANFICYECNYLNDIICDIDHIGQKFRGIINGEKKDMWGDDFIKLIKELKK